MLKLTLIQMHTHFRRTLAVVIAIVLGLAFFAASMLSGSVVQDAIRGTVGSQLRGADVVVTAEVSSIDAGLAETLSWLPFSGMAEDGKGQASTFTVVGVIQGGNAFGTNHTEAFIAASQFSEIVPDPIVNGVVVQVEDGAGIKAVRQNVADVIPQELSALTFEQLVDAEVDSLEQGSNALVYGLVAFSLIALFVAGIVISNTFSITIAQRTRELATFRCIGAEKRQIHRSVMIEALVLGLVASVCGIVLGYVAVSAGAALLIESSHGLPFASISPWAVILPLIMGVTVTLLSAIVPARGATAVHPLQALRQSDAPVDSASAGLIRMVLSTVVIVIGGAIMVGGMFLSLSMEDESPLGPLLIGMAGGAISFLGLLLASSFLVPLFVAGFGAFAAAVLGVPAKIAASNSSRNPQRTAATASALMTGVALITMMTAGASTVQATWNDVINEQTPVDLEVVANAPDGTTDLPSSILDRLRAVDGSITPCPSANLTLT